MCLTPLHCSGRMNRLGLPGFDIDCPSSFSVPLQPQDKSLQFSDPSLQSQVPCWRGGLQLTWTCLLYLAPCPVPLLLQHWQLCIAAVQCWQAQAQLAAMCHGSSPLTGQSDSGECCYFMALSIPVLSLAQQTCTFLEGSQPAEMGKGKFLWVKFLLKATEFCLRKANSLCSFSEN